jgi:formylmethanofuran dehydrogenase subunit E
MIKDIRQNCIECREDTKFGSGRFVNRIPAENDKYNGYLCVDCQSEECDECNEMTFEYAFDDNDSFLCWDCYETKVKKGLTSDKYDILEEKGFK